jgi:hypothetical protein
VVHCAADHHFRVAADRLPALRPQPPASRDEQSEDLLC